ncbi:APH domain-containing protein [Mycena indigotica]|uniref:APH domain-containing protein n=1 Tax=Mycena indigotica TaxID=2126181 RepID=A0A8H6SGV2_9AGAR|nr:APH domain-containing protein [Mycena indigotica]KAF7299134.1 APH domain-containing protein [Mycena indigotica]
MSSPPSSSSELENEEFGRLLDIKPDDLVALSWRIYSGLQEEPIPSSSAPIAHLVDTFYGSFNIVHILELNGDRKIVIRIPITGKSGSLEGAAGQAIESQVQTMRHIRATTTIPIPEVYHFDVTDNNELSAPYIAMAYIPGVSVAKMWFNDDESIEEKRLKILSQLAGFSCQLRELRFEAIGSLLPPLPSDSRMSSIGPCFSWEEPEEDPDNVGVISYGPFSTSDSWLEHIWAPILRNPKSHYDRACVKIIETMLPHLPQTAPHYTLTMPDFDSQNVMVDGEGNITGLIDWDNARTKPDYLGFARFPGWITRDWDPLMYGWPHSDNENSPEELNKYRQYYFDEMKTILAAIGSTDYYLTEKAHVFEALVIAMANEHHTIPICAKFVAEVMRALPEENAFKEAGWKVGQEIAVLVCLGDGELEEEAWLQLQDGLKTLMELSVS